MVRVVTTEQVGHEPADQAVRLDLLRCDIRSPIQRRNDLVHLAALGVRPRDINEQPRLPFGRKPRWVGLGRRAQGVAGIAEFDGHRDLMQQHVGRPELGVIVIPVDPDNGGRLPGLVQMGIRRVAVIRARSGDREL
jgi:hypothetical protein